MNVSKESDCKGNPIGRTLDYSQEVLFVQYDVVKKFKSFWLSRSLKDQEQLDLSRSGRDSAQSQVDLCGEYIMNFRVGTEGGCHNIPKGGTAECVRLWHY